MASGAGGFSRPRLRIGGSAGYDKALRTSSKDAEQNVQT